MRTRRTITAAPVPPACTDNAVELPIEMIDSVLHTRSAQDLARTACASRLLEERTVSAKSGKSASARALWPVAEWWIALIP